MNVDKKSERTCICGKKFEPRIVTGNIPLCPSCAIKKADALAKLHGMRF